MLTKGKYIIDGYFYILIVGVFINTSTQLIVALNTAIKKIMVNYFLILNI